MSKPFVKNINSATSFPAQKKTDGQKTKEFYKKCIDSGVSMINADIRSGVRSSRRNKMANYRLMNDIVDLEEVQKVVNPYGIEFGSLPNNYRNCPIINSNINVLTGEERKRFFNPIVSAISDDAVTQKLEELNSQVNEFLASQVTNENMSEEQMQTELQKVQKSFRFSYKDKRARMAHQIIDYLYRALELKEIFSSGFEDLLISSEEIYSTDIVAGEPVLRKIDPTTLSVFRSGTSNLIEDADILVEDVYLPVGEVIDRYYDHLTSTEISTIEESNTMMTGGKGMMGNQLHHDTVGDPILGEDIGDIITATTNDDLFNYGGAYDHDGNVRVTSVRWKGMRKLGILTFFDENAEPQETIVDENYKVNKELGEEIEWKWISEWHEGTRISNEIYVKMGPRPIQFRSMDNLSSAKPGIIGTISNVGTMEGRSMVDMAKPYQLLFNAYMSRMESAMAKDKGNIALLNLALIPEGWTIDKALYYAETMGWMPIDPFNEGQKGAAQGKLVGGMSGMPASVNMEQGKYIQQQLQMLDFLHQKIDEITGITPQRKGAVENRETVGGIERAVTQSSFITEKWFGIHDNTKLRSLRALLETAKIAWSGKSFKREYVLDDSTMAVLDFDSEVFNEIEYGVDITTATSDQEMMQALKSLTQPFMQNGGTLSMVMELFRTKDPESLQHKFEDFEKELQAQQQQSQQQQLEAQQTIEQSKMELEAQKMELDKYKVDTDRQTKIDIALIKESGNDNSIDYDKLDLESEKLDETIRHNKKAETIQEKSIKSRSATVKK